MRATPANTCRHERFHTPSAPWHTPLLAPILILSLALHAAVIGAWPDATEVAPIPVEATRVSLQLQHINPDHRAVAAAPVSQPRPEQSQTVKKSSKKPHKSTHAKRPIAHRAAPAPSASTTSLDMATPKQADSTTARKDGEALRKHIEGSLRHALIVHFEYPPIARRRGWEGVVQVSLRVEANGQLSQLRLVASSGHASLDRAALQNLGRVGQLRGAADWLQGRQLDMILPVRYQLIDS